MTRSSPVGVVILVLAAVLATGCSAQTSAVLQALGDAPSASGDAASEGSGSTATWWAHPHGYAMSLPAGWVAIDLDGSSTERLLVELSTSMPGAAQRIRDVLAATGAQGSMLAVDMASGGDVPPFMLVLSQSTQSLRPRQLKALIAEEVSTLPGLRAEPVRTDERLNDTATVRFDFAIDDPDLGSLGVRSSLFRYGGQAYLVSFVAPESAFDAARVDFDHIASSLRFGI